MMSPCLVEDEYCDTAPRSRSTRSRRLRLRRKLRPRGRKVSPRPEGASLQKSTRPDLAKLPGASFWLSDESLINFVPPTATSRAVGMEVQEAAAVRSIP